MAEYVNVNILGNNPKEMWVNAMDLYHMVIKANLEDADYAAFANNDVPARKGIHNAMKVLDDMHDEILRLIDNFDD